MRSFSSPSPCTSLTNASTASFAALKFASRSSWSLDLSINAYALSFTSFFLALISSEESSTVASSLSISSFDAFLAFSSSFPSGFPLVSSIYDAYASAFVLPLTSWPAQTFKYLMNCSAEFANAMHTSSTLFAPSFISFGVPRLMTTSIIAVVSPSGEIPFKSLNRLTNEAMSPPTTATTSVNAASAEFFAESIAFASVQESIFKMNAFFTSLVIDVLSLITFALSLISAFAASFSSSRVVSFCSAISFNAAFASSRAFDAASIDVALEILSTAAFNASSAIFFCESVSNLSEL